MNRKHEMMEMGLRDRQIHSGGWQRDAGILLQASEAEMGRGPIVFEDG